MFLFLCFYLSTSDNISLEQGLNRGKDKEKHVKGKREGEKKVKRETPSDVYNHL